MWEKTILKVWSYKEHSRRGKVGYQKKTPPSSYLLLIFLYKYTVGQFVGHFVKSKIEKKRDNTQCMQKTSVLQTAKYFWKQKKKENFKITTFCVQRGSIKITP